MGKNDLDRETTMIFAPIAFLNENLKSGMIMLNRSIPVIFAVIASMIKKAGSHELPL